MNTQNGAGGAPVPAFAWRIMHVHRGMYCLATRREGEAGWHDDCLASRAGCKKALRDLQAGSRPFHRPQADQREREAGLIMAGRPKDKWPQSSADTSAPR